MYVIRMMDLSTGNILYVTSTDNSDSVSYSHDINKAKEFLSLKEVEKAVVHVKEVCITHVAITFAPVGVQVFCVKELKYVSELNYFRNSCGICYDSEPLSFSSYQDAISVFADFTKRFKREFKYHKKEVIL